MGEIGTIWVKLGAKIDGLEKAFSDVDKATIKIGRGLQSLGKEMAIAGAAVTASLGLMIKKTADFGDELHDLRQKTGIAADTLSSFKLAADKSGTSLSGIAIGLRFLGRNMAEAASGGKEAAEAFTTIGVAVRNAAGGLRPMDEVMLDVADKFAGMEDGALKTSLAIKLFGRSGTELIPMLNLGRAGIAELREEAKRLGIVISNDTAAAADAFNDSMVSLKASLQGAGMAIGSALMPMVKTLAEKVTDAVAAFTEWTSRNQGFTASIAQIVAAMGGFLTGFGGLSIILGTVLTKLPVLAAAFGTTAGSLALLTAAVSAGAGAVLYYISILEQLKDAEAKLRSAETANADVRARLYRQLQEAAQRTTEMVIANRELAASSIVTNAAMDKIVESFARFGDQAEIMARNAILNGDFGPVLQKALEDVRRQAEATTSGTKALGQSMIDLGIDVKQLQADLAKAEKALADYKASADPLPGVVATLEKKVADLREQLYGADKATTHLADRFATLGDEARSAAAQLDVLMAAAQQADTAFSTLGHAVGGGLGAAIDYVEPKAEGLFDNLGKGANKAAGAVKEATSQMAHYFDGLYNDIANGFADAMEGLFEGTQSFKDFFVSVWGTIKKAFFKILAEMVAGFLVNFVKNIIAGMNLVKAATAAFGGLSSAAGAAGTAISNTGAVVSAGATGAAGAAASAGAMLGTALTTGFLAIVAPGLLQGIGELFGGWNKPKSAEQYQAERAWIEQLTAQWKAQGLSQKQIQDKLNSINWWMSEPGSRGESPGGGGGGRGRWAEGFSGLITQPTTATFAESGPEWVSVTPAGAGAGASVGAGGTIAMNFYAPIISTTGLTQQQCLASMDYIFNAAEGAARKRGFSLKP